MNPVRLKNYLISLFYLSQIRQVIFK
jgi:hypothetical protein